MNTNQSKNTPYALVLHGGSGAIFRKNMPPAKEAEYHAALNKALDAGETVLKANGTAMNAVVAAIKVLEDDPLFNAGKGAVFTNEATNELAASLMDGEKLNAGAICGVTNIKNPITAAQAVLEKSNHVLLAGKGAEQFAKEMDLALVDPSYFWAEHRWKGLALAKAKELETGYVEQLEFNDWKYGTVGCVALDKNGNLAAGTSTGGMTNKRYNRIGDTPIIGAGCYADNNTCAVSSTGHGEYFIRYAVAHDISARMAYLKEDLATAANHVIHKKLVTAGGRGGVIAVDKNGNIAMPHNTEGMYRAFVNPTERGVGIFKED